MAAMIAFCTAVAIASYWIKSANAAALFVVSRLEAHCAGSRNPSLNGSPAITICIEHGLS